MCDHSREITNAGDPDKHPVRMFFDLVDLVQNSKTSKSRRISRGFFDFYRETLPDAVEEGYQSKSANGATSVQFGEADKLRLAVMEANAVQYSASKSVKMTEELNKLARTTKDFNAFKQSAEKLDAKYNIHHLKTEC